MGCSNPLSELLVNIFISPKVYSNYVECNQYIDRYNELMQEKKGLSEEFQIESDSRELTQEEIRNYEDSLLELSFRIDNLSIEWQDCRERYK